MSNGAPLLEVRNLSKSYRDGDGAVLPILTGTSMTVEAGEFVAIIGASGAGKSTLLHLLGALDTPTSGEVLLNGLSYADLDSAGLTGLRNRHIGFVFQFHHLLRDFSALENVMMPLRIGGRGETASRARASELLAAVGVGGRAAHRPSQLSGGEQQRVAVARALAAHPALLLADEPSGNLDAANAERLHDMLAGLARDENRGLVVVTHNRALAQRADRVLALHDGRLEIPTGAEVFSG